MASKKKPVKQHFEKSYLALKSLSLQLNTYLIEEVFKGIAVEKIVSTFTRHQSKLVSGILGSVGLAGGAWAALSLWTGSLGLWSSLGYTLGLISAPIWIPIAGGAAGFSAIGGAVYGALALIRERHQRLRLHCITGFSKALVGGGNFNIEEEQAMRNFLQGHKIKEDLIEQLLKTTPEEALKLAHKHLSHEQRLGVARYIFPLVYTGNGIISTTDRRRFKRVCVQLDLGNDQPNQISRDYRQRLDRQWHYLEALAKRLKYFIFILQLNIKELDSLKAQLNELLYFDPRRAAPERRLKLLATLDSQADSGAEPVSTDPLDTASLIGAYSLMHTITFEPHQRLFLIEAFITLVEDCPGLEEEDQISLQNSREQIDKLYNYTHDRIEETLQK